MEAHGSIVHTIRIIYEGSNLWQTPNGVVSIEKLAMIGSIGRDRQRRVTTTQLNFISKPSKSRTGPIILITEWRWRN